MYSKNFGLKIFVLLLTLPFLGGCAHMSRPGKFRTVSVGMDKQQVINQLGEPKIVRSSAKNNVGQVIEVWAYAGEYGWDTKEFYFCDDKLVRWGYPGDWDVHPKEKKADNISEIRVR